LLGYFRSVPAGTEAGISRIHLFYIATLDHRPLGRGLAILESLVNRKLSRKRACDVLTDNGADRLKFRYAYKLNAGVGRHNGVAEGGDPYPRRLGAGNL
jgi:hypothetical protein